MRMSEKEDVPITVRLDRATRSDLDRILDLKVSGRAGDWSALRELVHAGTRLIEDKSIYHKNLMPVTYVTADVAGAIESPVYAVLNWARRSTSSSCPAATDRAAHGRAAHPIRHSYSMKWDGEWHITYEVFRDLGTGVCGRADLDLRAGCGLV